MRAGRREWVGLTVLLLPLLLVSMDVSVLYFAVPFIARDLEPTSTQQLWIFDVYGFVLASLLITMGALGDRIGRRRLLLIGAAAFGLASAAAAFAPSAGALIGARAVLGVAGATLMPSTLVLVRNMFHDEKQRSTAVAIWTAAMTVGVSLGPVLSGALLERFWWGSVFLINLPAMLLLLVAAPVLVPEFRTPGRSRFDLLSSALSLAAVLPAIWGIKEIAAHGVSAPRLVAIGLGIGIGVLFLLRQRRSSEPMIDLRLLRQRTFGGALMVDVVGMFGMAGFAIFTTQYLQLVLGLAPLTAALWSLAPSAFVAVAAPIASVLARRGVERPVLIATAFVLAGIGFAGLSQVRVDSPLWWVLVAAAPMAGGLVVALSLAAEMVMTAVTPERAGAASALVETGSEFGGALGMAVLGSVGAAVYRADIADLLPASGPGAALDTIGGAFGVADQLPEPLRSAVTEAARESFTHGMQVAALVALVIMVLAAVAALITLRRTGRRAARLSAASTAVAAVGSGGSPKVAA
jgi:MFS transporter, DHA2 family, multidrug resistance protein